MPRSDYKIPPPSDRSMNPNQGGSDIGLPGGGMISTSTPTKGPRDDTLSGRTSTPPSTGGRSSDGNEGP